MKMNKKSIETVMAFIIPALAGVCICGLLFWAIMETTFWTPMKVVTIMSGVIAAVYAIIDDKRKYNERRTRVLRNRIIKRNAIR